VSRGIVVEVKALAEVVSLVWVMRKGGYNIYTLKVGLDERKLPPCITRHLQQRELVSVSHLGRRGLCLGCVLHMHILACNPRMVGKVITSYPDGPRLL
jgi:hypothetical protein